VARRILIFGGSFKGDRDRYTMLPRRLLEVLRAYFREARPVGPELFPGGKPGTVLSRNAVNKALRLATARAAIKKRVTPQALVSLRSSDVRAVGDGDLIAVRELKRTA